MLCLPAPKLYFEILTPSVMEYETEALVHEGGALMDWIGALIRDTPESSLAPFTLRGI